MAMLISHYFCLTDSLVTSFRFLVNMILEKFPILEDAIMPKPFKCISIKKLTEGKIFKHEKLATGLNTIILL